MRVFFELIIFFRYFESSVSFDTQIYVVYLLAMATVMCRSLNKFMLCLNKYINNLFVRFALVRFVVETLTIIS